MWTDINYPLDGFARGWQARPASLETTPYQIDTSSGAVRRRDGCFVSAKTNAQGYKEVGLRVPERKFILVHGLVCWVAHGPRPAGKTSVDHVDRVRGNNHRDNVRWASPKDQAENRGNKGGRKRLLPFDLQEGEAVYAFRGRPGLEYTGPLLQFTSLGRIIRQGRVSQIQRIPGQYPKLGVVGFGDKTKSVKVHIMAWSAYHGPAAAVPEVINHKDHDPSNFRPDNLEASSHAHNARAAHDAGRHDHTQSKRQRLLVADADSGDAVGVYASQTEAARILRANQGSISQSLKSKKPFKAIIDGISRRFVCRPV